MADGKVTIEILGDASKFEAEVARLGETTSQALERAGGGMSRFGGILTAAVTAPLAAAGAKASQWALSTASAAEQADIAFSTMLGPERAKAMIADLTEFAKKTPFEMSGLTSATQKLLAYGFAAEDVIPTLTAVGDATAGLGTGQEGIDSVTRALGQMQAKGRVMSDEMLQLTEAGIPAWKYLAKALGTDVAGAQEKVTKGSVDAATGIAALKAGMEGDFGGMMADQSKTLSGALSNLGDAAEGAVKELYKTDAYKELASTLADLADPLGNLVEGLMPQLEQGMGVAQRVASGLSSAISSLTPEQVSSVVSSIGLLAGMGPALLVSGKAVSAAGAGIGVASKLAGAAAPVLSGVAAAFRDGGEGATGLAGAAGKAFAALKRGAGDAGAALQLTLENPLQAGLSALQDVSAASGRGMLALEHGATAAGSAIVSAVNDPLGAARSAAGGLAGAARGGLGGLVDLCGRVAPAAAGISAAFGGATVVLGALSAALAGAALAGSAMGVDVNAAVRGVATAVQGLVPMAANALSAVAAAIPAAVAGLSSAGPQLAAMVSELLRTVVSGVEAMTPQLVELVGAAAGVLCDLLVSLAPVLLEGAMQMLGGILQALGEVAVQLGEAMPALIQGLADSFAANAPAVLAGALAMFQGVVAALPQIIPALVAALPQVVDAVAAALPTFATGLLTAAVALFVAIVQALPQIAPALLSALSSLVGTLLSSLPSFAGALLAAAVSLFAAIAQAVPQVVGSVLSAVGGLLGDIVGAISNFSLADAGRQLVQGFADGISAMGSAVTGAIGGIVNSAIEFGKGLLGIHSPSRVFRWIGNMTGEGMALGIDDEAQGVAGSVRAMMAAATGAAESLPAPQMAAVTSVVASQAATYGSRDEDGRRSVLADVCEHVDAMADRLERALGEPVSLSVDRREAGKIVRGLVTA